MFSLLLAIIISASLSRSGLASPDLQDSLGFRTGGAESYQTYTYPNYGYGSRYYGPGQSIYSPGYSYFGNHQIGYPQDVYLPGRVNPFSYPYRSSRSVLSDFKRLYARSPQSSAYEIYETNPRCTWHVTDRYNLMPYCESIQTNYQTVYNPLRSSRENFTENMSNMSISTEGETYLAKNKRTPLDQNGNGTSLKKEPDLQMTYLGELPSSALKTDSHEAGKRSPGNINDKGMPFYSVYSSGSTRSASSPPVLVSPYRINDDKLRQSFSTHFNQASSSFNPGRPLERPLHSIRPEITHPGMINPRPGVYTSPGTHFTTSATKTEFSSDPIVSPFRTSTPTQILGSPQISTPGPYRFSRTPSQNGYYLFDVQPLPVLDPVDGSGYSTLKAKRTDIDSLAGFIQQGGRIFNSVQDIYRTGSEMFNRQGQGRSYSTDRGYPAQYNENQNPYLGSEMYNSQGSGYSMPPYARNNFGTGYTDQHYNVNQNLNYPGRQTFMQPSGSNGFSSQYM